MVTRARWMTMPPDHFKRPTLIRQARGVSANTKLALFVLASYADRHGIAWPSVETIADDCGLSYEATRKAIRGAIEAGLLERVTAGRPVGVPVKVTVYRVLPPGHPVPDGKPEKSAKSRKQRGRVVAVGDPVEGSDVVTKRPLSVVTKRPPNSPLNSSPVAWQAYTPDPTDEGAAASDPEGVVVH